MRRLYTAQVARPLSPFSPRPTRLGFSTVAWCRHEDLLAVISGCGAVSVFHLDAPGEVALLVGTKRAPARHLAWRNDPNKPLMLVVADAAGRITFWVARDRRVNVWTSAEVVALPSVAVAIGWSADNTTLASVLAHGSLAMWTVPDLPLTEDAGKKKDKEKRANEHGAKGTFMGAAHVRMLQSKSPKPEQMFGGQIKCATIAPGRGGGSSVAVVTVAAAQPRSLKVWQVNVAASGGSFEVKALSSTEMDLVKDGKCVACAAIPKVGSLIAVGDRGVICRWFLKNSRPGVEGGWMLQAKGTLEKATVDAVERGLIRAVQENDVSTDTGRGLSLNSTTRALQMCRKRKVYAFEVSADGRTMVTSSDVGLLVWNTKELQVVGGYSLADSRAETGEASPYWGLCISPGSAAAVALNGEGRVDVKSLLAPITVSGGDVGRAPNDVISRLEEATSSDGLKGGWDIIASVAVEGPAAANIVATTLEKTAESNIRGGNDFMLNGRAGQNIVENKKKLENLKAIIYGIVNPEDFATNAAKKLLRVSIEAILQSAPDNVKAKFRITEKEEAKQYVSADGVQKLLKQYTSTRVSVQQLAAAPLADWVMVFCAVWLQRCAMMVLRTGANASLGGWASLPSVVTAARTENKLPLYRGMVNDVDLVRTLHQVCLPAAILLALEDEYGEPEADARYFRFDRAQSAEIVAAIWDVSTASNISESMVRMNQGANMNGLGAYSTPERMASMAAALGRHSTAAQIIGESRKLLVEESERALGLHGSTVGAGFIVSCVRDNVNSASCKNGNLTDQAARGDLGIRTEWCPYDLVTGRPLPPWAPLRRCIISGLLAAENTQQRADAQVIVNTAAPWAAKWADESPLGGRWARVPSLDLERYELLPAVTQMTSERLGNGANGNNSRHAKTEEVIAANSSVSGVMPPPHRHTQMQDAPGIPTTNGAGNAAAAAAAAAAAVAAAQGTNPVNPQLVTNPAMTPIQNGIPGMAGGGALPGTMHSRLPPGAGPRVHASPGMSTASSTTDPGSNTSKRTRKRGSSSASRSRTRKRPATDQRTTSQFSDFPNALGMPGMPSATSPIPGNHLTRTSSAADVHSTDTRSTVTAATNATGEQQDTSKPGRRSKRRGGAGRQQQQAPTAAAGVGGPNPLGTGSMPPMGPPNLGQPPAQHAYHAPRAVVSKKQQPIPNQRSTSQVVAVAAAAAAAAAAAVPGNGKSASTNRNPSMLPMGMHPEGMAGIGKPGNGMPTVGYVGNVGVHGSAAMSPASGHAAASRQAGMPGVVNPGNVNMMVGGNVPGGTGITLNGTDFQQSGFNSRNPSDFGLSGMSNNQAQDIALLHSTGNAGAVTNGPGGQLGIPSHVLTNLALSFGLPPAQLASLNQEQLRAALEALSGRAALTGGMGGQPGMIPDSRTRATAPNAVGSMGLNEVDVSARAQVGGVGGMMGGNGSTPLSHLGHQVGTPGRTMVTGPSPLPMSMGNPGTSAGESIVSPPGGMPTAGISGGGHVNRSMPAHFGENNPGAMGGMSGGGNSISGTPAQSGSGGPYAGEAGERIWKGDLHVRGNRNDMMVPCVAIQCSLADKPPLRDASGWPSQLQCDASKLKSSTQVLNQLTEPISQWYVRFAPVDENGTEKEDAKLVQLVKVMVDKKLAFEINCDKPGGIPGTLYLWGMQIEHHEHSLLGVFRPHTPAPAPDLSAEQEWHSFTMS